MTSSAAHTLGRLLMLGEGGGKSGGGNDLRPSNDEADNHKASVLLLVGVSARDAHKLVLDALATLADPDPDRDPDDQTEAAKRQQHHHVNTLDLFSPPETWPMLATGALAACRAMDRWLSLSFSCPSTGARKQGRRSPCPTVPPVLLAQDADAAFAALRPNAVSAVLSALAATQARGVKVVLTVEKEGQVPPSARAALAQASDVEVHVAASPSPLDPPRIVWLHADSSVATKAAGSTAGSAGTKPAGKRPGAARARARGRDGAGPKGSSARTASAKPNASVDSDANAAPANATPANAAPANAAPANADGTAASRQSTLRVAALMAAVAVWHDDDALACAATDLHAMALEP